MLRDQVLVQLPPGFSCNSPTPEEDPDWRSDYSHAGGWALADLNAAHTADVWPDFSGIDILRRAIVVCPERILGVGVDGKVCLL